MTLREAFGAGALMGGVVAAGYQMPWLAIITTAVVIGITAVIIVCGWGLWLGREVRRDYGKGAGPKVTPPGGEPKRARLARPAIGLHLLDGPEPAPGSELHMWDSEPGERHSGPDAGDVA